MNLPQLPTPARTSLTGFLDEAVAGVADGVPAVFLSGTLTGGPFKDAYERISLRLHLTNAETFSALLSTLLADPSTRVEIARALTMDPGCGDREVGGESVAAMDA